MKIVSIQIMRAAAATAVVAGHFQYVLQKYMGLGHLLPDLTIGSAGVDLFFVISGFVMVYASRAIFGNGNGPAIFLVQRILRIVPLYWAITSLYLLIAILLPSFAKGYGLQFVVGSYLFFPAPGPDGVFQPVVGQGWTLNYEMFFYVIFALTIWARQAKAVLAATAALVALVLIGIVYAPLDGVAAFWTDPIILEFALGMLVGLAYSDGVRVPRAVGYALIVGGLALLVPLAGTGERLLQWGLPMSFVVAGAVLGDLRPTGRLAAALSSLGDASYALYLSHSMVVLVVVYWMRWTGADGEAVVWLYGLLALGASITLAFVIHRGFELPVAQLLRRAIRLPPARPQAEGTSP